MSDNLVSTLNPQRAVYSVLGCLCKNPQKIKNPEIILTREDFEQPFHKIVFSAIHNLAHANFETPYINEIDIDNYLASYPRSYEAWTKHDGVNYVKNCIKNSNESTFKQNYEHLKKFSLLRHLVNNGIDVTDLYDYKTKDISTVEANAKKLNEMELDDIMDFFSKKMIETKESFATGQESKNFRAGDDLDGLLEQLRKAPEFGYPFQNAYYNAIFRGMRKDKFMLRSAGTGTGKTRQALMDACTVSCDEIYDIDRDCWVYNQSSLGSLFISTELEKVEVQLIMLAFITGVSENIIKDGVYSHKIQERLEKGIEVVKKAPIYCEYIDDFSITDIEMLIERNIIEHDIYFVAFDYIQMTPKLSKSMATSFGSSLREDQILVQFSAALKKLATKYHIFMESSTQLNRNAKDVEMRDTTSLRGGSATAD